MVLKNQQRARHGDIPVVPAIQETEVGRSQF